MEILKLEIKMNEDLKVEIHEKVRIFKRELSYLREATNVKGWILKI